MSNLQKDILTGLTCVAAVVGFMAGEFIISSALLAATTLVSNININNKNL